MTEIDNRQQALKNSFIVTNTLDSTQAIFYKDKFITDFTPIHSLAYDVQFPFIRIKLDEIINTESDEMINDIVDMGDYFITLNYTNGSIKAISKTTCEDITSSVVGKYIESVEVSNFINSQIDNANTITNTYDANADPSLDILKRKADENYCSISYNSGIWQLQTNNGDVKYELSEEDGWICEMPFFQNNLVWFERSISNTDSSQIKIFYITGEQIYDKTIIGKFIPQFFPTYFYIFGKKMVAYSSPHICISEMNPNEVETKNSLEFIVRGKTLVAKAKAAEKKKYASYQFNSNNYLVYGNYLIYVNDKKYIMYDIENDKEVKYNTILGFFDDYIVAKNLQDQLVTIDIKNGKLTSLAKYMDINFYSEDVAIAKNKGTKIVIDSKGEILLQDNNDFEIVGSQSSENVILALNKKTGKYGYIYNPLIKDTLIYDAANKTEQLYAQGMRYYNDKKYKKAKSCFETLYKHEPSNVDYLVKYADCLTAQKYYTAAINQYNKALTLSPNHQEAAEHLAIAQGKQERAEAIRATIYAIASSVNDVLESTAQALNVPSTVESSNDNLSNTSKNNQATSSSSDRNRSQYWWSMKKSYYECANQISMMKTYPERNNARDRQNIQSQMKEIRNKLQQAGYTLQKSKWEDWDGISNI